MSIYAYLFDAEGQDRQVKIEASLLRDVGDQQILWIDVSGNDGDEFQKVAELLEFPESLVKTIGESEARVQQSQRTRPRLDLYSSCFHVHIDAIQERSSNNGGTGGNGAGGNNGNTGSSTAFKRVTVNLVVFPNIVVTLHEHEAVFLDSFDQRIKGDTHLGRLDGPAFLGALLNWHITGYFRALEALEAEVDRIDDAALRLKDDRDLLVDMVRARRRVALVRGTLLPHREVYATLARPSFAPFVTAESTFALGLVNDRLERAVEATENARELVLGSFDIFTTQTTLRTNEVVKALTVISALLLPAGVITNIAMLFVRAPVYDIRRVGFWEIMVGMLIVAIAGLMLARKRKVI